MLDFEKLDNLYTKAFALRKKKHWLNLPWDFLIGIKTKKYGMWYGLPIIDYEGNPIGFAIYDKAYGLPVVRYTLDANHMEKISQYEFDSFLYQQNVYYFTFENKAELMNWHEAEWIKSYCDKHQMKCRGKRCYPSFHHLKPGFYAGDLENTKEIAFCETFVTALAQMNELLEAGELLPQQWRCAKGIKSKITIPALLQQAGGKWQLTQEELPPAGGLNWPRLIPNDFDTVRFKRFPKNGSTWQLEKFTHDMNELTYTTKGKVGDIISKGIGVCVDSMIIYDESMGHIMFMDNFFLRIEGQTGIMGFMSEAMEQDGRPMKIIVGSEESYEFIKEFCRKLDIQLVLDEVPRLVTVRENILAGRNPMDNFDDENWEPTDPREEWGGTSGYMPDVMDKTSKINRLLQKQQRHIHKPGDKSNQTEDDMVRLVNLIGDFLQADLAGNIKAVKNTETKLNAFLDKCAKSRFISNVDDNMLEILLNLAMAAPMETVLFRTIVGEYQKRSAMGQTGFLAIVNRDDM